MAEEKMVKVFNREGKEAGTATLTEVSGGVNLHVEFHGLPAGEFAMHIHEKGAATAPDFTDAGSHFNPTGAEHGKLSEHGKHVGDMDNIVVGEDGTFVGDRLIEGATLAPDSENTLQSEAGTSLIVHVGPDDYHSQPTGAAGDRQLGAVIFPPKH